MIIRARNVKPNETLVLYKHQRSSRPLTFHPRPLILDCPIRLSEITGLFELKFHMEYSVEQKQYEYDICYYFNIIKGEQVSASEPTSPLV